MQIVATYVAVPNSQHGKDNRQVVGQWSFAKVAIHRGSALKELFK